MLEEHHLDATNKVFGRLASEVAELLRGKNRPQFNPRLLPQERVVITGLEDVVFTGKKKQQKKYFHYSGYHGGIRERSLAEEFRKNPGKIFRSAVYHMLPPNKTRDEIIKNLIIK